MTDEVFEVIQSQLDGFAQKGARALSKAYIPTGHFNLDFAINYGMLPGAKDLEDVKGYDPSNNIGIPMGKVV